MMHARCLFPILLILIAGRNLIVSDDRVYPTSRRLTKFEQLNRRTRDIHLRPKATRRKMTERSRRVIYFLAVAGQGDEKVEEHVEFWTSW